MRLKISDLWRWDGVISRGAFLVWSVLLFVIKFTVDWLIIENAFGRSWTILDYFKRPVPSLGFSPAQSPAEPLVLMAVSLPFLWAGVVLCIKRLRAAKFPLWLAVLFVVPILKWFLFLAAAILPERQDTNQPVETGRAGRFIRWFPESKTGSAVAAILLSAVLGGAAAFLGTEFLKDYGWGLFAGVPFCLGFFSSVIHAARQPRKLRESLMVSIVSVALVGGVLLLVALEGLICILMAAPIALVLAVLGGLAGHAVQASRWQRLQPRLFCLPVLAIPVMLLGEHVSHESAPLLKVSTVVDVDAPPERVWTNVVKFAELPPPTEMIFKSGIAYPVRAEIRGCGPGAVRHCVFSTGAFEEPIEIWDEPRLLEFSVTSNPAPMEEWTPYHEIHPPHLKGFLVSRRGRFLFTPLPGERTRLEGTTWYMHNLWPAQYWQVWSDGIIHAIHRRVLTHVKQLSEQKGNHP